MVKPALAATRAVDVLDFLAAHAGSAYTLSELGRALDVSLASLLAVLEALTESGYLVRDQRRKTYELGPALIASGQAAAQADPLLDLVRAEMPGLAADVGTECVASVVVAGQILILATEGRPGLQSPDVRVGQRLPLLPPLGQVFVAWSAADEIAGWLKKVGSGARRHLEEALDNVRERGYSVTLHNRTRGELGATLARLAESPRDTGLRRRVTELVASLGPDYELLAPQPARTYRVASIAAPVFDDRGRVAMAVTLNGFRPLSGRQVVQHAERLGESTRMLTREAGGRLPAA
jgi:DNA-binding IclR family transcriptional regulator